MTALLVIIIAVAVFMLLSAFYHLDRLIRAEHDCHHDAWVADGRPFFVGQREGVGVRSQVRLDARLLGVALPHAGVGSFLGRSHAPFTLAATFRSRLELAIHDFSALHCYLFVAITLSHLTIRCSRRRLVSSLSHD